MAWNPPVAGDPAGRGGAAALLAGLVPRAGLLAILPAAAVVFGGLVLPVGYLLLLGFNPARLGSIELTPELTLNNYAKLFVDAHYWRILGQTAAISAITTLVSGVLGFVLAVSLWRAPPRWKGLLTVAVLAPLLVSIVARTFGWMVILGDRGLLNGVLAALGLPQVHLMHTGAAIVIGLVHVFLPYVVLAVLASLDRVDPSLPEAAHTLGASGFATVRDVILPLAMPGVVAGVTIVFSLAMSSYVTPALMGGGSSATVATAVYQQFVVNFSWHFGAVLVTLLLAASLLGVLILLGAAARLARRYGEAA